MKKHQENSREHICNNSHADNYLHEHAQSHIHEHKHSHEHIYNHKSLEDADNKSILTIRCNGGLSGDMLLTGLCVMLMHKEGIERDSAESAEWLAEKFLKIMPEFAGNIKIGIKLVNGIAGFHADILLPESNEARSVYEINQIIENSRMDDFAKETAKKSFGLLAEAEAFAHQKKAEEVHFHEVGALDSILDICAACLFYSELNRPDIICQPLPLSDGLIKCAHGVLSAPAPAVLYLLKNIPVRAYAGRPDSGELITPTAIAMLKSLNAKFGSWPEMRVLQAFLVYGDKVFENAPNGAIFAIGTGKN